jgi:hypothetical protein
MARSRSQRAWGIFENVCGQAVAKLSFTLRFAFSLEKFARHAHAVSYIGLWNG